MDRNNFASVKRIEDKYITSKEVAQAIIDEVKKKWDVAYPDKSTGYTLIKSTYFDSPTATFYRDHLNDKSQRLKMRLRSYAPDGKWENRFFLEVKGKDDGEIVKNRIELDKSNIDAILGCKQLSMNDALFSLNKKLLEKSEIVKFVDRVNEAIKEYKLCPVVSVTYKRVAYQDGNNRITMDKDLTIKNEGGLSQDQLSRIIDMIDFNEARKCGLRYSPERNAILEVKYSIAVPELISSLLKEYSLEKIGCSKYMWAMYKILTKDILSNVEGGSDLFHVLMGSIGNGRSTFPANKKNSVNINKHKPSGLDKDYRGDYRSSQRGQNRSNPRPAGYVGAPKK